jgi:hypothetical protein
MVPTARCCWSRLELKAIGIAGYMTWPGNGRNEASFAGRGRLSDGGNG